MRSKIDRYAEFLGGRKRRMESFEACVEAVRAVYPTAYAEGSTGFERSFWVDGEHIAHSWPVNSRVFVLGAMWLRIKEKT